RDYSTKTCPGNGIANAFICAVAEHGQQLYTANLPPGPYPTNPLRAKQIAGPNNTTFYCSVGTYNFYHQQVGMRDGLWDFGYPLKDEYQTVDTLSFPCTIMPFERGVLKTTSSEGARPALRSEIAAKGW